MGDSPNSLITFHHISALRVCVPFSPTLSLSVSYSAPGKQSFHFLSQEVKSRDLEFRPEFEFQSLDFARDLRQDSFSWHLCSFSSKIGIMVILVFFWFPLVFRLDPPHRTQHMIRSQSLLAAIITVIVIIGSSSSGTLANTLL